MANATGNPFGSFESHDARMRYLNESMDILAARFSQYDMVYTPGSPDTALAPSP